METVHSGPSARPLPSGGPCLRPSPDREASLSHPAPLIPVRLGDETFVRLDLTHPDVEGRILDEMAAGVDVYYDRDWPFTRRLCRFLLDRPELLEGRDVLVAGAGVGLEAVVAGRLARRLWINDRAPVALELLAWQLRENGLAAPGILPGSFADVELPPVDLILACFVVYDRETRDATLALEARAAAADIPLLLGGEDIGGHLGTLLGRVERPVRPLLEAEGDRIVLLGESRTRDETGWTD